MLLKIAVVFTAYKISAFANDIKCLFADDSVIQTHSHLNGSASLPN